MADKDNRQFPNRLESAAESTPDESGEPPLTIWDAVRADKTNLGDLPVSEEQDELDDLHDWETAAYGDRQEDYCPYCGELNDLCGEINDCQRGEDVEPEDDEPLVERILRQAVEHNWLESLFIGNDRFDMPSMEAGIAELADLLDVSDEDADFRAAVRQAWTKLRQSEDPSAYERMIIRYAVNAFGWLFSRNEWLLGISAQALADKIGSKLSRRQGHNIEAMRVLRLYPQMKLTRSEEPD